MKMCNFFSFVHDGKKIYYFDGEQRKNGVKMPDGNSVFSYDSHSSITCFHGLDDDGVNKFEYNPFTDRLVLDGKTVCEWDKKTIREQLAGVDLKPIAGDVHGAQEFIRSLKTVPWLKSDGTVEESEEIKVFETRAAARDAARAAARAAASDAASDAARAAAWAAAWDAARDAAWDAARDAAWDAAWAAARDAARAAARAAASDAASDAAWAAAWDAACYCALFYVCSDLQIDKKHREHVRKRFEIWQHGYGVFCDVEGVLYVYKRI